MISDMIKEKFPDDTHPEVDPALPSYFKTGTVISIDDDIIIIKINDNYLIGNTGDGVATNSKAA